MKKVVLLLSLCLPLLAFSCSDYNMNEFATAGEGPTVKRTLDIDPFTGITLSIAADVKITQGNRQSVEIEAQDNIIDLIETEVKGDVWKIHTRKSVRNTRSIKIYITIPKLTSTHISGSGNIVGTNTFNKSDELDISVSGSGDINFKVEANAVNLRISGSGDILLSGSTNTFDVRISGSGDVQAQNLVASDATIGVSGSGGVRLHATEQLTAKISGSGDIQYKGQPRVTARSSGSGKIEAI